MTFVHRRSVRAAAAPLVAAFALLATLALALPAGAQAARVLVMGPAGHVTARENPFVPAAAPTPAPNDRSGECGRREAHKVEEAARRKRSPASSNAC